MTTSLALQRVPRQQGRLSPLLNPRPRKHVLLIEDDKNLVHSLARFLRKRAFDMLVEYRGDTGLETALFAEPDAILLDLGLPGMRGTKVLEELQRLAPHIPVVVITGEARLKVAVSRWNNVCAFYSKPFPAPRLVRLLDTLLGPPLD